MKPHYVGLVLSTAAAIAGSASPPAYADFYQLDGRFQCLAKSNAICGDATQAAPMTAAAAPLVLAPVPPTPPIAILPRSAERSQTPPIGDPISAIAARLEADHPTAADVTILRADAKAGNPRAIELLAWCELAGLGTPRDPVGAYLLYGRAAAASVPHASDNQSAIYETVLTQEQRQHVLDIGNDALAHAQLAAGD